jgi:hypothetical protein
MQQKADFIYSTWGDRKRPENRGNPITSRNFGSSEYNHTFIEQQDANTHFSFSGKQRFAISQFATLLNLFQLSMISIICQHLLKQH